MFDWQDLLEREHRNQDSIETERTDLIKFTEVLLVLINCRA